VIERNFAGQIQKVTELDFDEEKGQLLQKTSKKLFGIEIDSPHIQPAANDQSEEKLVEFLMHRPEYIKYKSPDMYAWLKRWWEFCRVMALQNPDKTEPLKNSLPEIFKLAVYGCRRLDEVLNKNLNTYAEQVIGREVFAHFVREAPDVFVAPTGSHLKIEYPEVGSDLLPFVQVRLQEVFGLQQNPKILFHTVPLQFHLLGPNYRPVQVTSDILSFWQNTYAKVRKELRSRYPKHSWPEDGLTAPPVRKGKSST
jgi:ATP-dependent helicase HrpB